MALTPLTDLYIDETYQRLVQTNDARTEFADGLGQSISFGQTPTGSLLTTASVSLNTITFTKGDGSTFPITVNTGSGGSISTDISGLVTTSSFNAFTSSVVLTSSFNTFTSSVVTTSSFNTFTGSYNTGSFSGSFIGSLQGTASWAESASVAISSSFATTASYAMNAGTTIDTSAFVTTSSFNAFTQSINTATSSFVTNAQTSSFVTNSQTSSFVQNSQTSSFVTTSSFNSFTSSYNTGSFTGSFTGNLIGTATTASYVSGSVFTSTNPALSASFATTASYALTSEGGGSGGISQGKVVAIATGYSNLF